MPVLCQGQREEKIIETVILILTGVLLILLLLLLRHQRLRHADPAPPQPSEAKTCPLCGEKLLPTERVKSVLYPASGGAPDRMMEIFGCPHCYPTGHSRVCPVCKKPMPPEAMLIARYFQKPGKIQVHVLGCSLCYTGGRHAH